MKNFLHYNICSFVFTQLMLYVLYNWHEKKVCYIQIAKVILFGSCPGLSAKRFSKSRASRDLRVILANCRHKKGTVLRLNIITLSDFFFIFYFLYVFLLSFRYCSQHNTREQFY